MQKQYAYLSVAYNRQMHLFDACVYERYSQKFKLCVFRQQQKTATVEHLRSTEPKADYKASHYADAFCSLF